MQIPEFCSVERFRLPATTAPAPAHQIVGQALKAPIGAPRLGELARGKRRVLIVSDDLSRPTPVVEFLATVLEELRAAGLEDRQVRFIMALGTHRPMTRHEIQQKLGREVANRYEVFPHRNCSAVLGRRCTIYYTD